MTMNLNPLDEQYHDLTKEFREQIAVLYFGGLDREHEHILLLRSYVRVCLPGAASFDASRPGADSAESWEYINSMMEKNHVVGVFHTHPPGVVDFSGQDWSSMRAFARANGKKYIWYGVQSLGHPSAHFVCMNMLAGRVICHDYGFITSSDYDTVIPLKLPQKVLSADGMLSIPV